MLSHTDNDFFDVFEAFDITLCSNHVFSLAEFEHTAADAIVRCTYSVNHATDGDPSRGETVRIDNDLVLVDMTTNTGDLGYAGRTLQVVAKRPILEGPKIRQTILPGLVNERILIHPSHPSCVRTK